MAELKIKKTVNGILETYVAGMPYPKIINTSLIVIKIYFLKNLRKNNKFT
jgi:hypothetical protein